MNDLPSSPEEIAAARLAAYRPAFLYADHQLLKRGLYVEAARQLARRAELTFRGSIVLCIYLLLRATFHVIGYVQHGSWLNLPLAVFTAATGLAMLAGAAHQRGRTRELRETIEALLPQSGHPASIRSAGRS
jgi:hypothetical protein